MSAAGDIANRASKGISEGTPDLQGAVKTGSEENRIFCYADI